MIENPNHRFHRNFYLRVTFTQHPTVTIKSRMGIYPCKFLKKTPKDIEERADSRGKGQILESLNNESRAGD